MNCNYAVAIRTTMYIHSIEFSYNIHSYGHLSIITGYFNGIIYSINGVFLVLITGITWAITAGTHRQSELSRWAPRFRRLELSPGSSVEIRFSLSDWDPDWPVPCIPGQEGRRLDRFPSQIFQVLWASQSLAVSLDDTMPVLRFGRYEVSEWEQPIFSDLIAVPMRQAPHLDWSDLPYDIGTDNSVSARDNFSHEAINYPNPCQPEHFFSMVTWLLEWCHTDIHSLDEFMRYKN